MDNGERVGEREIKRECVCLRVCVCVCVCERERESKNSYHKSSNLESKTFGILVRSPSPRQIMMEMILKNNLRTT